MDCPICMITREGFKTTKSRVNLGVRIGSAIPRYCVLRFCHNGLLTHANLKGQASSGFPPNHRSILTIDTDAAALSRYLIVHGGS
ncbi:hypothetical protein BC936DRAFT_149223 [Jimgerdemannia flammicorona]|uniref:Uncharacterized protein n=1 Tax=Jimgerdemannia flammicorona TaxID=994334 RepID=A0A433D195_9FUNG|nr:hypothetical protein BC936DRAFT_149223 [Jimgerdemannia flammicorona]